MKKINYPADESDLDRAAAEMKYHNTMDKSKRDIGAKTKVRAEKVVIRDTNTGKRYGTRTLIQKTTEEESMRPMLLMQSLLEGDYSALPGKVISEIQKNIRKGARDTTQQWTNALELVHKAYQVTNARRPIPAEKAAWNQYEDLIAYAVRQLANAHGIGGKWRTTDSNARELTMFEAAEINDIQKEIGDIRSRRFFVEIPGIGNAEIDAKDADEIIDALTVRMRRGGARLRVDKRDDKVVVLSIWKDDVKRDEIIIKEVS